MTAFTGLPAYTPLRVIKTEHRGKVETLVLGEVRSKQVLKLDQLMLAMDKMHREVKEKTTKARADSIKRHNARTPVRVSNFDVGDFVVRSFSQNSKDCTFAFHWRGTYRVTKVLSEFIFEVQDLRSSKLSRDALQVF